MIDPRKAQYEVLHHCRLLGPIGPGVGQDGFIQLTDRSTAVKFFDRADRFGRELEVYRLLRDKKIRRVAGHKVPRLIDADEALRAIEMTIVERPFLLDFAGAKLPHDVPEFEPHVLEEHVEHLKELFEDKWAEALHVAEMFRRETGYVLLDIHPGNVAFAD